MIRSRMIDMSRVEADVRARVSPHIRSRSEEADALELEARHEPDFDEADRLMNEARRLRDEARELGDEEALF
jgi:hypothetical protein